MDERVLKWITVMNAVLMVTVCVCLYFLPGINQPDVLLAQQEDEAAKGYSQSVSASPQRVVKQETYPTAQLCIELPSAVRKKDLDIKTDVLNRSVYLRFPGGVQDYFGNYAIRGSSDHIEEIIYYTENGDGVIVLELDGVYEVTYEYNRGSAYLSLLDPHEVYDKVLVLDAGHGGGAPGAVKQGIAEKTIDLAILLETKKLFDACPENIGVYYTRTEDVNPTLEQRVKLANAADADLFISIHNNSEASGKSNGTSGTLVMYSESDHSKKSGKKLAEICARKVSENFGSVNRGLLHGDRIYIIRESQVPAALIEVGFMSNSGELDKLSDSEYQKKAAKGIYEAVMEAFKEGY